MAFGHPTFEIWPVPGAKSMFAIFAEYESWAIRYVVVGDEIVWQALMHPTIPGFGDGLMAW